VCGRSAGLVAAPVRSTAPIFSIRANERRLGFYPGSLKYAERFSAQARQSPHAAIARNRWNRRFRPRVLAHRQASAGGREDAIKAFAGSDCQIAGPQRVLSIATRILLVLATFLAGLLAGGDIDRAFVAMPAWQEVGAAAWAEFGRHADLGNGLLLYPFEAFGSTLLTLAAALAFHFDRAAPRAAAFPLYAACALAVGGLGFTVKAAPIMLGIRDVDDAVALQAAFEGFWYWGNLRAVCQVLAFLGQVVALAMLWRSEEPPHG
jgi:hypothetical protein